jgi:mannose-6-phosphate isomerase-like protein (cupin superfamily)
MNDARPQLKRLDGVPEQIAGDRCLLRELFHPDRDPVPIGYSIAHAFVEPGGRTLDHTLEQSELYYVIRGRALLVLDGVPYPVGPGSCCFIPPRCHQYVVNEGEERFEFLCIVDPPWTRAGERVESGP